jgi:hypothetical protein
MRSRMAYATRECEHLYGEIRGWRRLLANTPPFSNDGELLAMCVKHRKIYEISVRHYNIHPLPHVRPFQSPSFHTARQRYPFNHQADGN